jgi:hypothetical protein
VPLHGKTHTVTTTKRRQVPEVDMKLRPIAINLELSRKLMWKWFRFHKFYFQLTPPMERL